MSKASDIRVVEALVTFEPCPFRTPLKFGGRIVDRSRLINVQVTVENRARKHATGFGSMPVGNVWAWPTDPPADEKSEAAMVDFVEALVDIVTSFDQPQHPVDLMFDVSGEYDHLGKQMAGKQGMDRPMPRLAELVAASALDAAIHDAFGRVNHINSYDGLSRHYMNHDLAEYLDETFAGEYLDAYTSRTPQSSLPLYHLVGALDPLTPAEVSRPIADGLPETLDAWIAADGLTHLKIKMAGDDLDWDVQRVLAVEQVTSGAHERQGLQERRYSVDFNEKCQNEEYVLTFLNRVREKSPAAYDAIQYIEQPTHRDLKAHPDNRMHEAAKLKPIVIDESLIDFESLLTAREQGYTGAALKACKGQTEALFAAAAAQKLGMFLCVQDLTCPGYSFLHSASLAARIPTVTAIEGNGRQYCPASNRTWARSYPGLFEIKNGRVETGVLTGEGLGF